jgi:dTDP-4-amino-4,6-dideoxygalactose transaminase
MDVTEDLSRRLIRLPLWVGLDRSQVEFVIDGVAKSVTQCT